MKIVEHGLTSDTIFANASGMGGGIVVIGGGGASGGEMTEQMFERRK